MLTIIIAASLAVAPVFDTVFAVETIINLPPQLNLAASPECTYWNFCTVNPDGNGIAFIDPASGEIQRYDFTRKGIDTVADRGTMQRPQPGEFSEPVAAFVYNSTTVAKSGRGREQVDVPLAVNYTGSGDLLVSDLGNRRVSTFAADGKLKSSFLLPSNMNSPNEMKQLPSGDYLMIGLNLDSHGAANTGTYCNLFSLDGILLDSSLAVPSIVLSRNLWNGVAVVADIDDAGDIYAAFNVEDCLYWCGSGQGKAERMCEPPDWFIPPPKLDPPLLFGEKPPREFPQSWTRIIRLVSDGQNRLVMAALANGRVSGISLPFVLEVYGTDGATIASRIPSDCFPIGRDVNGSVYFLTADGKRLLKTHIRK
ncbi:MAG: hypothetical protein PHR28_05260 [candidate division Zixibacteria bacterium]|nr:hypothetical protein [candidate division Zixibacteria bacterium]